jgi:uncharacterized protein (TIGR03118 family)
MRADKAVRRRRAGTAALVCLLVVAACIPALAGSYEQINLVSDIAGVARNTDIRPACNIQMPGGPAAPCLVNPWGITNGPTTPFWISDNGAGVSTLYDGAGTARNLVVAIPPPAGSPAGTLAAPTGIVFNGTGGFTVSENGKSGSALFIFATEDGTISGWSPGVDLNNAVLVVDNSTGSATSVDHSALGAVYKGLALATVGGANFIYATNFRDAVVEVYDSSFHLVKSFTDTTVPAGFAPFGIQNINGKLFITFAKQNDQKHDDVAGPGNGFVDVLDLLHEGNDGHLDRFASGGVLNSPWGVALAPSGFGQFSHHMLIGNFGDGHINAFDQNGVSDGPLKDFHRQPITINGLWGLKFGGGAANNVNGATNSLFFTAGIGDESHGLFGMINVFRGCDEQ